VVKVRRGLLGLVHPPLFHDGLRGWLGMVLVLYRLGYGSLGLILRLWWVLCLRWVLVLRLSLGLSLGLRRHSHRLGDLGL
jgi:hypothetical protein